MERNEFLSTSALENAITNRKKDTNNVQVNWLHIRWLRFQRGDEFKIRFKETLNDFSPFRIIDVDKTSGAKQKIKSLNCVQQDCLYTSRRPVTNAKKKDMADLLPYIPPVHHGYFKNLPQVSCTRSATQPTELAEDEIIFNDDDN